ncbi:hemolysin family protein [Aldersonia sp. NBC_00410]|uniref:hemolysin family protein n=1 Tax=Aldersonia sp. NBC_00410 TaxID=2975954 RepID=UPI002253A4F9|nr:hemolysin family protein [Aldersonia sp. NBC_00410]MCX5042719.1 hemolysin family protein [Aldersonia sp. NBC_00410]
MTSPALIVLAVVLVAVGGVIAAIDSALNTVSPARVEDLVRAERPGAVRLERLLVDRARYVNLVVLLRITAEITATVLLAAALLDMLSDQWALTVSAVTMVLIDYIVIGIGPRTLGRQHAYAIALVAAWPVYALGRLLGPLTRLLILIGNALTPGRGFRNGPFASEIELRELVDMAQERGVVADDERRMIQSVFELGDTPARAVMVPRTEMVWIEANKTAEQAASLAMRSGNSRIPVIGENVDDVLGVVYLKDLVLQSYGYDNGRGVEVSDVMRPAVFVPDSKPLDSLLGEMQRDRNHMALLVDEYGGIAGLVTIEDILEEIVGEIADEYDTDETPPVEELGDGEFRVSARLSIEDVAELFDTEIEEEDVETVGGLLAHALGRVPLPGAEVVSHGLLLHGEGGADSKGRVRVHTVRVSRFSEPDAEQDGADSESRISRFGDAEEGSTDKRDNDKRDRDKRDKDKRDKGKREKEKDDARRD